MDSSGRFRSPVAVEGSLVFPGGPDDPRQAIGESHGGTISTAPLLTIERPLLQSMQRALAPPRDVRRYQGGASAVDQERT